MSQGTGLSRNRCDIVCINIVEPTDNIAKIEAIGRRFQNLKADVSKADTLLALVNLAIHRV
ncbi:MULTISPECIES: hypothetical protein [unclassified Aeromonas]|uniref:hypothetical protein n=1 Tax=Aeromonas TaxID=642 RepID=UPI003527B774